MFWGQNWYHPPWVPLFRVVCFSEKNGFSGRKHQNPPTLARITENAKVAPTPKTWSPKHGFRSCEVVTTTRTTQRNRPNYSQPLPFFDVSRANPGIFVIFSTYEQNYSPFATQVLCLPGNNLLKNGSQVRNLL